MTIPRDNVGPDGIIGSITAGYTLTFTATLTGNRSWDWPDRSDTVAGLGAQTFTGQQAINSNLVVGATALVSTERARVAGGTDATALTPAAADVLIGGGSLHAGAKIKVADTSTTSIQSAGGASLGASSTVAASTDAALNLTCQNTDAAGTSVVSRVRAINSSSLGASMEGYGGGYSGTILGVTITGGMAFFGTVSSSSKTLLIGHRNASANEPIVFGIANAEVARFTNATGQFQTSIGRLLKTRSVAAAAGTTVLDGTDDAVFLTGATTHTFTLPAAADGRILRIKNRSSGTLTLNRAGADTIDGGTTTTVLTGASVHLIANGTDWCIFL